MQESPTDHMTTQRLTEIEATLDSPNGPSAADIRELIAETKRARADATEQYTEADYWREGYRLTKGLSNEEINAMMAVRDASKVHPRPCWFPHEACVCDD